MFSHLFFFFERVQFMYGKSSERIKHKRPFMWESKTTNYVTRPCRVSRKKKKCKKNERKFIFCDFVPLVQISKSSVFCICSSRLYFLISKGNEKKEKINTQKMFFFSFFDSVFFFFFFL